ncbi:uncharacterized protein LOC122952985 [Acropora millepora]|uniref:uncharacterized protein LOC122952985 n=1 Tax=Acropora millepora TaxID=45264 RepID=UPI001CF38DBE|nr:uncharacterized protein LOC122952985 [Acropora millepora]
MVAIFSILVIFWIQGRAVCDELYPISVVEDIVENQPEWSSDDYIEPLEGQSYDQEFLASSSLPMDDTELEKLKWMKEKIVIPYKFKKAKKKDMWESQPNFARDLGTPEFIAAANRVEKFFKQNNNWELTKTSKRFRTPSRCLSLLYITAARYLYVTHVLYDLYNKMTNGMFQLIPCSKTQEDKIIIPDCGVCYSKPCGTASCTSDLDVGLVGIAAGSLTEAFNNYIQGVFGKPSELVFDANVYAFSLEFSMPSLFFGLPDDLADNITQKKKGVHFEMQELASAYYKVFKYNETFFNGMVQGAQKAMKPGLAKNSARQLKKWLKIFSDLDGEVPLRCDCNLITLRTAHNMKYQYFVKTMSDEGKYKPDFLGIVARALIYAAEAYHTRGAIRHVVGGMQMEALHTATELSTNEAWVSMIENWGETNKEYEHCRKEPLKVCFLKMSKYMWRMCDAMKLVRAAIPAQDKDGLVYFGEAFANPGDVMNMWLEYKNQGKTAANSAKVIEFLKQFNCVEADISKQSFWECMSKINDIVNEYNIKLAATVTDKPAK